MSETLTIECCEHKYSSTSINQHSAPQRRVWNRRCQHKRTETNWSVVVACYLFVYLLGCGRLSQQAKATNLWLFLHPWISSVHNVHIHVITKERTHVFEEDHTAAVFKYYGDFEDPMWAKWPRPATESVRGIRQTNEKSRCIQVEAWFARLLL